jgi:hypothetical protein
LPIIFFTPAAITGMNQQNSTTATSEFFNRIGHEATLIEAIGVSALRH